MKRILAVVAIVVVLAGVSLAAFRPWEERNPAPGACAGAASARVTSVEQFPVLVTPARRMTFEAVLAVSGNVESQTYALVSARIPGTLDELYVDEGDRVVAGETKLFRTDWLKLSKAVEVARQQLSVAASSVREREANLEQERAAFDQDRVDVERFRRLHQKGAIASRELELQESKHKQSAAKVKHAQALIDLARAQQQQAASQLSMAEKDLADSLVLAPIGGRVSQRLREPGEMAAAGTPVLKIEDLSVLEVSAYLPEEAYGRVEPGRTKMRVRAVGQDLGEHAISFKSPTIHPKLRTFEVKCVVSDPPAGVAPGAIADVTVVLDRREGVGAPTVAVEQRQGGHTLFVVQAGKASQRPVKTGMETGGWVEILDGAVEPGAPVVTTGQNFVEDGAPVSVVKEGV